MCTHWIRTIFFFALLCGTLPHVVGRCARVMNDLFYSDPFVDKYIIHSPNLFWDIWMTAAREADREKKNIVKLEIIYTYVIDVLPSEIRRLYVCFTYFFSILISIQSSQIPIFSHLLSLRRVISLSIHRKADTFVFDSAQSVCKRVCDAKSRKSPILHTHEPFGY